MVTSKKMLILACIAALLVGAAIGVVMVEYYYPTTGTISTLELSVKWLDGSDVLAIEWFTTENSTEYVMDPMNITNISNIPVYLTLSYGNTINITDLQLTWNYTGNPLSPDAWEILELYQNCTATGDYSYDTIISVHSA